MNASIVKDSLIEILQEIQEASELECPPLSGATKPIEALPKFNSKIWPVAIGMLAAKLGVTIPDDVNIFSSGKTPLTIDQAVAIVVDLSNAQAKQDAKAAKAS